MSGSSRNKGVHFAPSPVPSSPASSSLADASIMSREDVSGALAFVNSQLLSHGFTYGNGISTDGLADIDATKLTKCLMGLLAQRTEDMKRVEDLGSKYRTLSYEHESLSTRLRDATDRAANAERETNVHKSRLATSQRTLQTTSAAHKHANAELTRVRTAAQALRATHISELRKRDKENERMLERWTKLSDSQLRISSQSAGIIINGPKCANAVAADGGVYLAGTPGYLDVALEEAESSRRLLADENEYLRELLLRALNEGQQAVHQLRVSADPKYEAEPPAALTLAKVFPLDSRDIASGHLSSLFNALQSCITVFADPHRTVMEGSKPSTSSVPRITSPAPTDQALRDEAAQLRREITTLTSELEHAQRHATAQTAQIKTLLDQVATVQHAPRSGSEPAADKGSDEARKALEALRDELTTERQELTRATLQLDRERAAVEKDRERLLQEKQAFEELRKPNNVPSFPVPEPLEEFHLGPEGDEEAPALASPRRQRRHKVASPKKRSSPVKVASPAKAGKKSKGRRASLLSGLGGLNLSPAKRGVAAPSFQTEVVIPPPPSALAAALAGSTNKGLDPINLPQSTGPLLSAFVLPPPSPMAKIPPRSQPLPPPAASKPIIPPLPTAAPPPIPISSLLAVPETPGARAHASRISHAFSPAKPSPLSRILMMANSPDSPPLAAMPTLAEMTEDEESSAPEVSPTPTLPLLIATRAGKKQPSLAAELGLPDSDSDRDSPDSDAPLRGHGKNKLQPPANDKGKNKARAPAPASAATRHGGPSSRAVGVEKENVGRRAKTASAAPALASKAGPIKKVASSKPPSTARVGAGLEGAPKATLRRVVVDRSTVPVPLAGKKPFV